ncbi:hypothetical protein EV130_10384 [Rhizobium azibense]|uniref:Uncharacterized protein n=1 Tax=Rhizobium azibense TaxID=1136135 RepID=A0A4R3QZP5_9HYPH|nr:hypothetical protein EV130_10384 [Rhizobium azibense]
MEIGSSLRNAIEKQIARPIKHELSGINGADYTGAPLIEPSPRSERKTALSSQNDSRR